ncbi:MAG: copper resistance protein CopC [Micropepsaceae bacterium]
MLRTSRCVWVFAVAIAAITLVAHAHASLKHASPYAGAVLAASPQELQLEFGSAVQLDRVEVSLTGEGGYPIDLIEPAADARTGQSAVVRRVLARPVQSGTYHVFWRVLSADGHFTRGDYSFEVRFQSPAVREH